MKKIFIIIFLLTATLFSSTSDSIKTLHPGDTLRASEPLAIFTLPQFQKVVSDKQQLKTDSLLIDQLNKIISNYTNKDSLYIKNSILQDTITSKYKQLYNVTSDRLTKLEKPPIYDSKVIWFIFGVLSVLISAKTLSYTK